MAASASVRTGTAGWVFEPWRGTFYPTGLVQKKELGYASRKLGAIEINATFRGTQKPASFARWAEETPAGFRFSVKGPQLVTHIRRLRNCRQELANFFASGPLALGDRLGPFIWQLPPNLSFDADQLGDFLALLPKDANAYRVLAREADPAKVEPYLDGSDDLVIRHAIEMRHPSYADPAVDALLRSHNVARVIADTAQNPSWARTADFAYCRLQGPPRPDAAGYAETDIAALAQRIVPWRDKGEDVYAFFVHEDKLNAPHNAMALAHALDVAPPGDD